VCCGVRPSVNACLAAGSCSCLPRASPLPHFAPFTHSLLLPGTISANNNGFGTSGVFPGSKVFALQVFNKLGTGSTSSIVSAINWLASSGRTNKIRVANMSLGGPSSMAVCGAVQLALQAGITFVVAAGEAAWQAAQAVAGGLWCPCICGLKEVVHRC
jgi:subtilisin family serine protease